MKRILLLLGAAAMAACSDATAPTPAPAQRQAPSGARNADMTCRSGYIIAYDENGNAYCSGSDLFAAGAKHK